MSGYNKDTCTPMFISITIAKGCKQPRCPTSDEWIKKIWYLYTMEFYSAIKKSEILSFAGNGWSWSEISQVQIAKGCMFSLICGIQTYYKYSNVMKNRLC
jgi:hypothetical protein